MLADDHERRERGRRALRRRLVLDFEPLRDTLARGLGVPVQDEAAIYCTAAVEALCEALFAAALPQAQAQGAGDAALTVSHLQLALRSHAALAGLLHRVPAAGTALGFFLDGATSRALHDRQLLASRDAPHLHRQREPGDGSERADEGEAEVEWHARARREWARRADDPFAAEDFAAVLKAAHPAFSLSYNATALLSALVRELLNAACDQLPLDEGGDGDGPREVTADDASAALGRALGPERDELPRPSTSAAALLSPPLGLCLPSVPASTPFGVLLPRMCRRGHLADADPGAWLVVYRGREVDARATPAVLELPDGSFPSAADGKLPPSAADDALWRLTLAAPNAPFVFLVPRKWWGDARRNDARRGRLASQRPQDAKLRSLVAASESRVRRALRTGPSAELRTELRTRKSRSPTHSRSAVTLSVTSPASSHATSSLSTSLSATGRHSETNMSGGDSLSALLQQQQDAAGRARILADALRTAAREADAVAKRADEPRAVARDEWAGRVRALDALVAHARAAAAQMLARVEGEDADADDGRRPS